MTHCKDDIGGQRCRRKASGAIPSICGILERFATDSAMFHSSTAMPDLLIAALGCLRFVTKVRTRDGDGDGDGDHYDV